MSSTYTPVEVIVLYATRFPGSRPVAAEHDDMARFCDGEPWFVFVGSEEAIPERIVLEPKPVPTPTTVEAMTAVVTANPTDTTARLVLADAITEQTGDYAAALAAAKAIQQTVEGTTVVVVGRDGARTARTGRGFSVPIWCSKMYRAERRLKDALLTWRLVRTAGDGTSGHDISGPMQARAKNWAEEMGVEYRDAHITHGTVCL